MGLLISFSSIIIFILISLFLLVYIFPFSGKEVFIIGLLGGIVFGALGTYAGNYLADKAFGKDEFVLTSANLYYKYIPEKYRKKGNNPHLKWNDTYLCSNVKSYIIECIVNEVDIIMRVMNIPNNIFELEECLGYEVKTDYINDESNSDFSTDDEDDKKFVVKKLTKGKKFVGDLVTPYKGIGENAYKIDFVIYGIDKENISLNDWMESRAPNKKNEKNIIQIGFVLSVY